ncbi:MAG TPA: hypothetical protein VHZ81_00465 [Galbitalea sp.]|jgi:hypothetical protein|nr:hypothetical protein [Galbitalea sp.]
MVYWDDLGFPTNYRVDADPEFPGDGHWDYPQRRVFKPNSRLEGGPQALIRPSSSDPWILVTAFSGLGALYATANPDVLCVFEQFERLVLVDVNDPSIQMMVESVYPVRVAASVDQGLLLVSDWTGVTAIGATGVRWITSGLPLDDFKVTRADGDRIYYRGVKPATAIEVRGSLDARTGAIHHP